MQSICLILLKAGLSKIRLYAGAYAEWAANPENKLEK